MQVFIQALLAVVVFGINIKFSDKDAYLQDKQSCSRGVGRGKGYCELPCKDSGQSPVNFAISCF